VRGVARRSREPEGIVARLSRAAPPCWSTKSLSTNVRRATQNLSTSVRTPIGMWTSPAPPGGELRQAKHVRREPSARNFAIVAGGWSACAAMPEQLTSALRPEVSLPRSTSAGPVSCCVTSRVARRREAHPVRDPLPSSSVEDLDLYRGLGDNREANGSARSPRHRLSRATAPRATTRGRRSRALADRPGSARSRGPQARTSRPSGRRRSASRQHCRQRR
jgi:hypothetical protein